MTTKKRNRPATRAELVEDLAARAIDMLERRIEENEQLKRQLARTHGRVLPLRKSAA